MLLLTVTSFTPVTQFRIDLILAAEPQLLQPGTVNLTVFTSAKPCSAETNRTKKPTRIRPKIIFFFPISTLQNRIVQSDETADRTIRLTHNFL